jgi:hypothetical protein
VTPYFHRSLTSTFLVAAILISVPVWLRAQEKPSRDAQGRLPDVSGEPRDGTFKASIVKNRDSKAPIVLTEKAPASVPIRVAGKVLDLKGQPVAGAKVYLLGTQSLDVPKMTVTTSLAATATTRADGYYSFIDAKIPTSHYTKSEGADTPYVYFQVIARAEGYGIGWHQAASMYAVDPPQPKDMQGRLPLDTPSIFDVYLRPEASLKGQVVDEDGKPVMKVKIMVLEIDLLDEKSQETTVKYNFISEIAPYEFARVETDRDGRFLIAGLPIESCCWLHFLPQGPNAANALFASTSARVKTSHPDPEIFNGRRKHDVYPADMTVILPTTRKLEIRVVADDDGKPVTDVQFSLRRESLATGFSAYGVSDASGKLTLELPAGKYDGLSADPSSLDTRFIPASVEPLVVAKSPAVQPLEVRMKPGAEILIEAIDGESGKGISKMKFEIQTKGTDIWEELQRSTYRYGDAETDEAGKLRCLLAPVAGKKFRIRVASINPGPVPDAPAGFTYEVVDKVSDPFEMTAGKTTKLRFMLTRKTTKINR